MFCRFILPLPGNTGGGSDHLDSYTAPALTEENANVKLSVLRLQCVNIFPPVEACGDKII